MDWRRSALSRRAWSRSASKALGVVLRSSTVEPFSISTRARASSEVVTSTTPSAWSPCMIGPNATARVPRAVSVLPQIPSSARASQASAHGPSGAFSRTRIALEAGGPCVSGKPGGA